MITDHKYTTTLLAAIDASKTIMDIYENEFDTIIKADGSPLTKADTESNRIIIEINEEKITKQWKNEVVLKFIEV